MKKIDYPAITVCGQGMIQDVLNGVTMKQFEDYVFEVKGKNLSGLEYSVSSDEQIKTFWNEYIQAKFPGSQAPPNKLVNVLAAPNPDESIKARVLTNPDSIDTTENTDTCPDGFIDTSSSGEKFPDFDVKCIKYFGYKYGKPDLCLESGTEKLYFTDRKTPSGQSDHQKNKGFALGLQHALNEGGMYI